MPATTPQQTDWRISNTPVKKQPTPVRRLTLNLSIPQQEIPDFRAKLQDIAYQLGFRHGFHKGSVSALLSGIVNGEVDIVPAKGNEVRQMYLEESTAELSDEI